MFLVRPREVEDFRCLVYWLLLFGVICYDSREVQSDALIDIYRVTNLWCIRAAHTTTPKQHQHRSNPLPMSNHFPYHFRL